MAAARSLGTILGRTTPPTTPSLDVLQRLEGLLWGDIIGGGEEAPLPKVRNVVVADIVDTFAGITLGEFLRAAQPISDQDIELFDFSAIDLADYSNDTGVTFDVAFTADNLRRAESVRIAVSLPAGSRYVDGSASLDECARGNLHSRSRRRLRRPDPVRRHPRLADRQRRVGRAVHDHVRRAFVRGDRSGHGLGAGTAPRRRRDREFVDDDRVRRGLRTQRRPDRFRFRPSFARHQLEPDRAVADRRFDGRRHVPVQRLTTGHAHRRRPLEPSRRLRSHDHRPHRGSTGRPIRAGPRIGRRQPDRSHTGWNLGARRRGPVSATKRLLGDRAVDRAWYLTGDDRSHSRTDHRRLLPRGDRV